MLRTVSIALVAILLVVLFSGPAVACPTCKYAVAEGGASHDRVMAGYFYSILFLMAMPFVLVGSFGSYAYLLVRRARSAEQAEDEGGESLDSSHHAPRDERASRGA